mgnify:CR=1 FL=1
MVLRVIIFLVINFAALALGSIFTSAGVSSDWYTNLNQAPWTPPGWVFGAAWTSIMIFFAFYMAYAYKIVGNRRRLITLFIIQWILNVSWNPVFFKLHLVTNGLILITSLTILIGVFLFGYYKELKAKVFFVLPYFIWLLIATSLNAYILLYN